MGTHSSRAEVANEEGIPKPMRARTDLDLLYKAIHSAEVGGVAWRWRGLGGGRAKWAARMLARARIACNCLHASGTCQLKELIASGCTATVGGEGSQCAAHFECSGQ